MIAIVAVMGGRCSGLCVSAGILLIVYGLHGLAKLRRCGSQVALLSRKEHSSLRRAQHTYVSDFGERILPNRALSVESLLPD